MFSDAHQHLACAKLAHRDGRHQQAKLVVAQAAQPIDLAQVGHQLALELCVGLFVFVAAGVAHMDGAGRERNLDRMAPQRIPQARRDAIAHVFLHAVVRNPVPDPILDREIAIVPRQHFRRRIAQHLRHVAQQGQHDLAHVIGRHAVADPDCNFVAHVAGGVVVQHVLGDHGVGNLEPLVGARYDRRRTPCDSLDPPDMLAAADPVARLERVPHRERQAAEDVAQGLLQTRSRAPPRRRSWWSGSESGSTPKSVYSTTITTANHNTSISRSLLMVEKWTLPRRVIASTNSSTSRITPNRKSTNAATATFWPTSLVGDRSAKRRR